MKNGLTLVISSIIYLGIIGILLGKIKEERTNTQLDLILSNQKIKDTYSLMDGLREKEAKQFEFSFLKLNNLMVNDINQEANPISRYLLNGDVIILKKSKFGCNDCFLEIIDEMKRNKEGLTSKFIILFSFESHIDFTQTVELFDLTEFTVLNTAGDLFSNFDEPDDIHFLGMTNQSLVLSNFFIPDINNHHSIENYIKMITRACLLDPLY